MKHPGSDSKFRLLDRRTFLQSAAMLVAGIGGAPWSAAAQSAGLRAVETPHIKKLGWRLGCHAYSFRQFSFHEAIEKTASLGLRYIGAYPTQPLSREWPDLQIGEDLPAAARKEIKSRLADAGLTLVHFGVCGLEKGPDQSRRVFDFAREMGVEAILAEPPKEAFDHLEKLCDEYRIDLAIHNHPSYSKYSRYWHPDRVLKQCAGRSRRIGACADTGQWVRSDLDPIECLRQLEGRIVALHFKDMSALGRKGQTVPLGTGVCDVKGMLAEIRRQRAKPVFMIEYEINWANNLPEIARCVAYFESVAATLVEHAR